jgi:hypothetical protein
MWSLRPGRAPLPSTATVRGWCRLSDAGVVLFAGDLFTTLPPGPFDFVLCAAVTNMFDGQANLDLYRRLRPIIADGGDAHTIDDYHRWLGEAGYGPVRVHELDRPPQTIVLAER